MNGNNFISYDASIACNILSPSEPAIDGDAIVDLDAEVDEEEKQEIINENPDFDDLYDATPDINELRQIISNSELRLQIVRDVKEKTKNRRGPYNKNHSAVLQMIRDKIWYVLPFKECPPSAFLEHIYHVKSSTIRTYRQQLRKMWYWIPHPGNVKSQRVFSVQQENEITNFISHLSDTGS